MKQLALLFILFAGVVYAAPGSVAIRSSLCGTDRALDTSGTLVRYQGKNFVLTSAWGVLEESTGVCHDVRAAGDDKTHSARLALLDWAGGFALLEVDGLTADVDLEAALPTELPSLEIKSVSGDGSERAGRIAATKSTRHHFPALPSAYEVGTERLGTAFIGAPVYGAHLYGIVSSQYVEIIPGSRALIHEWKTAEDRLANHIFVIPLTQIQARLKKLELEHPSSFQPAETKLNKRDTFYLGPFKWLLHCPPDAGKPPKDGIGPIGGADGVGVGGSMKGTETCSIEVEAQTEVSLEIPDFVSAQQIKDWKEQTGDGRKLQIPFLFGRNPGKQFARYPFFSLPHLMMELRHSKYTPIFLVMSGDYPASSASLEALRREAKALRALLVETYPKILKMEDERADFRTLYAASLVLESLQWKLLSAFDLQTLLQILDPGKFAEGVTHNGESLRVVLQRQLNTVNHLYNQAGGSR